jgi:deoxyribonuclease-4
MHSIKLGPAGSPVSGTLEGVRKVRELGLQAMEVEFVRGVRMSNDLAKQCGKAARENSVQLSVHAPYYINLTSDEKEKREASRKRILDSCERGHHLGATNVVFHAAYYGKLSKDHVYEIVKEAIEEMQSVLESKKWNVRLAPETTGKGSQFGDLEELARLRKQTGCGICVDFAHIYARNHGVIDYGKVLDSVEGMRLRELQCHFSGITYTPKGERKHEVISSGKPPFEPLARELVKRKMDAVIISESPVTWKDSLLMKEIFEKLGYKF